MKIGYRVILVYFLLMLLGGLLVSGCRPSAPPPSPPSPTPQPPDQALSVVFVTDWKSESPEDVAVYTSPDLINFCKQSNHELRVVPVDVVSEKKDASGKRLPPEYLVPYLDEAKGKGTPIMILGRNGKVRKSFFPMPTSAQTAIASISGVMGEAPDKESVWANGEWRKLGLLPMKPGAEKRWPSESNEGLVPKEKWKDVDLRHLVTQVENQNGYSCCAVEATDGGMEATMLRMGMSHTDLSIVDLYSRVNGGRDAGSMLEDNLNAAKDGVCSVQFAEKYGVTKTRHKPGWEVDRSKHAIQWATLCPTLEHVASALQKHRCVVIGVMVTDRFSPDKDGVIGPKGGRARGGHAILLVGMKKIGDDWYLLMLNSWGANWGQGGFAYLHKSWFEPAFGAFAIVSLVSPSDQRVSELLSNPYRSLNRRAEPRYSTAP